MFSDFKKAVVKQFETMKGRDLFRVAVDKDALWETYLRSFPTGSNPIYKNRTEHDCSCCRHFIKSVGGLVAIVDGRLVSLWDVDVDDIYQPVANALALLVESRPIEDVFLHYEPKVGTEVNYSGSVGDVVRWEHFALGLPAACVARKDTIPTTLGELRSTHDVLLRSLKEITLDSVDTVLELIAQNSLYRGEENKFVLDEFRELKKEFSKTKNEDLFVWSRIKSVPASVSRIRNTSIGTLLTDLSEGADIDQAVGSFEAKVAPTNYKRPTALVTKAMIQKAQAKIEELGFTSALERRYATLEDITINNILFADRTAKKKMNVFEELASTAPEKVQNLDKVEEVTIENFLANVLPKAESLEVLFENRHSGNLVSLIAPVDPASKTMFKWNNNFSWSYAGEVADSIKERVKRAGGRVDGDLRCSLSWFNFDDLDLRMIEPGGEEIFYGHKMSQLTGGNLDVDMNAGAGRTRNAVENICYPSRSKIREGLYRLYVNNFRQRETSDTGFDVEMEFNGVIHSFSYPKIVRDRENVDVVTFKYTHKNGVEIIKSLPSSQTSKQVWSLPTQTFQKVDVVMFSPNYWDDRTVGNKHYFFMLDGCLNEDKARGFFNEFLIEELNTHRKVFEVVGSKMKTEESTNQLSGLGFSSTQRNYILARVKGSFSRTIKITF